MIELKERLVLFGSWHGLSGFQKLIEKGQGFRAGSENSSIKHHRSTVPNLARFAIPPGMGDLEFAGLRIEDDAELVCADGVGGFILPIADATVMTST